MGNVIDRSVEEEASPPSANARCSPTSSVFKQRYIYHTCLQMMLLFVFVFDYKSEDDGENTKTQYINGLKEPVTHCEHFYYLPFADCTSKHLNLLASKITMHNIYYF